MSGLLSEERFFVIHELHRLIEIHIREQRPGEVVIVASADVGAEELLGNGNAIVETHLLQKLAESEEVDGVGVAESAVDVEQDGLQRRLLRQSATAAGRHFRWRRSSFRIHRPRNEAALLLLRILLSSAEASTVFVAADAARRGR